MSSKQIASAVRAANAICKDVAGNLMAGQDLRVLTHLKNLMSVLSGIEEKLAAGNDFRAEKRLDAVLQEVYDKLDEMPPFDPTVMDAARKKWDDLGADFDGLLQPVGEALNPDEETRPEVKAAIEALKEQLRAQGAEV